MKILKKSFSLKKPSILLSVWFLFSACESNTKATSTLVEVEDNVSLNIETIKSQVYTTAHSTNLKLTLTDSLKFEGFKQPLETDASIIVDVTKEFQTFLGIGAALTDASAETFYKLTEANQAKFLEAYYNQEKGIGYSLGRTIIHSCDFSTSSYTYIEEGDKELTTFNIDHDKKYRLPFTKKAIEAAGGKLTMYASPWSPPAFMKSNNDMLKGGKLLPEFYQPWANYYAKFIKATKQKVFLFGD